jgi:hypothetical protein
LFRSSYSFAAATLRICVIVTVFFGITSLLFAQGTAEKPEPKPALANLGIGWTYLYADQGAGERESLNGWYARPSVNLGKGYSLFVDFTNYYGKNKKGAVNSHGFTMGLAKQVFATKRVKPSVFAESGDVRVSNAGTIVNQFGFNVGFSLVFPISRRVAFTMTPAEWIFLYPKGDPRNDYNAKVGVSFGF